MISVGDSVNTNIALVGTADPAAGDKGLVVRDVRGNATTPVRVDTVGTTVQPVSIAAAVATTPPANASTNLSQVAGTATVTGGVAGILAVGGNVANAVAATANPVPVGGIFTTTLATLTTGQTATQQFTAAQNAKHDITTIAGTAPTTVGKLDVKGADGDVFVRQATGTNLHAVIDTGSTTAVTQATATNLNAAVVGTGTAGTPSGNILTVQGVASMTKLLVTPDSVALPANQSVNVAQVGGTNTVTGGVAGILAVGGNVANAIAATANPVPVGGIFTTTPATLTTGQTATAQFTAAQNLKVDITTVGIGVAATGAGISSGGTLRVAVATDSIQPIATNLTAPTIFGNAAVTTAQVVKSSAGNVYAYNVWNGAATVCWLQFMNAASSPVLGTAAIFSKYRKIKISFRMGNCE